MIVDTHCHLNHEQFSDDVSETVARALDAGVYRMIVVGYDIPSSRRAVALADHFEPLYAAVAIHPHDANTYDAVSEDVLRELADHAKVVAVGEIGLDYHYDFSPRAAQFA